MLVSQNDTYIISPSLYSLERITSQVSGKATKFIKNMLLNAFIYFFCIFFFFVVVFHHKICVFIIFISVLMKYEFSATEY